MAASWRAAASRICMEYLPVGRASDSATRRASASSERADRTFSKSCCSAEPQEPSEKVRARQSERTIGKLGARHGVPARPLSAEARPCT